MRYLPLAITVVVVGCRAQDGDGKPVDSETETTTAEDSGGGTTDSPPVDTHVTTTDSDDTDTTEESVPPESDTETDTDSDDSGVVDTGWSSTTGVPYQMVAAGTSSGCALRADGHPSCWFMDYLWDEVYLPDELLQSIDVGNHPCGLGVDGYPVCWGEEDEFDWITVVREVPTILFEKVQAGTDFACGLDGTGAITCWGDVEETLDGTYVDLCMSITLACGLHDDGSITCIKGTYGGGMSTEADAMNAAVAGVVGDYTSLACDNHAACVLDATGAITCWGDDAGLIQPPADAVAQQIALGDEAVCGLLPDQTISCWGSGRLITGYDDGSGTIVGTIPPGTFSSISAGGESACGVATDGTIHCWGSGPQTPLE